MKIPQKTTYVHARIEADLKAKLEERAFLLGKPVSELIRNVLHRYINPNSKREV